MSLPYFLHFKGLRGQSPTLGELTTPARGDSELLTHPNGLAQRYGKQHRNASRMAARLIGRGAPVRQGAGPPVPTSTAIRMEGNSTKKQKSKKSLHAIKGGSPTSLRSVYQFAIRFIFPIRKSTKMTAQPTKKALKTRGILPKVVFSTFLVTFSAQRITFATYCKSTF